jgi:hypothetical protein
MRLVYEISASDTQLRRVLRGVEQEARASSRRMAREQLSALQGPGRKEAGQARRYDESQARASARAAESLDRQRSRSVLANIRNEERERMRSARSAAQAAEQLDRQRSRGLMQQIREQERAQAHRERTARSVGSGAARSISGGIGTVARVGGAALGLLGGFSAAGALEEQMSIKRQATQVALSAGDPTQKAALEKEALGVKGFTGTETLGALGGFVQKTGDLGAGRADIKTLGSLALASSSDFGEMGEAAGQAFNVIRDTIKDPVQQVEALNEVLRTLVGQGQLGAVEIKDMTTELAGLGAASRAFTGGPVELLKTMGAMAQASVARGGSRDAAEATTAVTRFAADLTKHPAQKALAGLGVNVFADKGRTKLKDPRQIMGDIMDKTHGDLVKVEEVLNAESKKALAGFAPLYLAAEKQKKGTGRAAINAEFERFNSATPSMDEINKRASLRLEDPDLQIKETMKAFNAAVGNELLPVLTRMIPKFAEALPSIAKFTEGAAKAGEYLLENPYKGIGLIIAGSVAKDIAAAGLGSLLEKLLVSVFAGQAATSVAGGAAASAGGLATGAAGAAGGVGLALGGAIAAAVAGTAAAGYEGYQLTQQSGGLSGVGAGIGGVLAGRGYAGGVDDYMNEQARAASWTPAAGRSWFDQDPSGRGGAAGGQNPAAASKSMADQVKQLFGSPTTDLANAAKELSSAAKALKDTGGNRDPRSAPIKPG